MLLPVNSSQVYSNRYKNINSQNSQNLLKNFAPKANIEPSFTGNLFTYALSNLFKFKNKNVNLNKLTIHEIVKYPHLRGETSNIVEKLLNNFESLKLIHNQRNRPELFLHKPGRPFFQSILNDNSEHIIKEQNYKDGFVRSVKFTKKGTRLLLEFENENYGSKNRKILLGVNEQGDNQIRMLSYNDNGFVYKNPKQMSNLYSDVFLQSYIKEYAALLNNTIDKIL